MPYGEVKHKFNNLHRISLSQSKSIHSSRLTFGFSVERIDTGFLEFPSKTSLVGGAVPRDHLFPDFDLGRNRVLSRAVRKGY